MRAQPIAGQASAGHVLLVRGAWVEAFLDEIEAFGEDPRAYSHDDQVGALSGAYGVLAARGGYRAFSPSPRDRERAAAEAEIERVFGRSGAAPSLEGYLAGRSETFFG